MAGVMIAAPGSGSGKTMVTCGLLTLLKRKGYNPAAFKCGPDYIDGLFHRRVLGVENGNLDSFFETGTHMRQKLSRSMEHHFVVAEGVMGYFDGLGGVSVQGSSFEIGRILGLPAILVVDGRGASVSLMALIQGFLEYDTALLDGEKKLTAKRAVMRNVWLAQKTENAVRASVIRANAGKMRKNIMRKKLTNYTGIFTEPQAASGTVMKIIT